MSPTHVTTFTRRSRTTTSQRRNRPSGAERQPPVYFRINPGIDDEQAIARQFHRFKFGWARDDDAVAAVYARQRDEVRRRLADYVRRQAVLPQVAHFRPVQLIVHDHDGEVADGGQPDRVEI